MIKKIIGATVLVSAFLLVGCVGGKDMTSNDVYLLTKSEYDNFKKDTWITSPIQQQGSYSEKGMLRAHVNKNGKVDIYQLYFSAGYIDWKFYDSAYDSNGKALSFQKISRDVVEGGVIEDFAINVSRSYLEHHRTKDLTIKVYGKGYDRLFGFGGVFIDGFLRKVDAVVQKK